MLRCAVALIPEEIVFRKLPVVHLHDPVPGNLRHNGRRRHGDTPSIAAYDCFLREVDGDPVDPIDEKVIWSGGKAEDCLCHCGERRLEDVHRIDHVRLDHSDTDRDRVSLDHIKESLPLPLGKRLGISYFRVFIVRRQDNGGGEHRTR